MGIPWDRMAYVALCLLHPMLASGHIAMAMSHYPGLGFVRELGMAALMVTFFFPTAWVALVLAAVAVFLAPRTWLWIALGLASALAPAHLWLLSTVR